MSDGMDRTTIAGRVRCFHKCDPRDCVYCEAAHFLESESCEGELLRNALREIRDHHEDEHFEAWARAFAKDVLNLVSEELAPKEPK